MASSFFQLLFFPPPLTKTLIQWPKNDAPFILCLFIEYPLCHAQQHKKGVSPALVLNELKVTGAERHTGN